MDRNCFEHLVENVKRTGCITGSSGYVLGGRLSLGYTLKEEKVELELWCGWLIFCLGH